MPTIDDQLKKKKAFKKREYRSYLSLDEAIDDIKDPIKTELNSQSAQIPLRTPEVSLQQTVLPTTLPIADFKPNQQRSYKQHTINTQRTSNEQTKNIQAQQETNKTPTRNSQESHKEPTAKLTVEVTKDLQETHKKLKKISFNLLTGLRRKIVGFIYENCKAARSDISDPFTFTALANLCGTTARSAGETIKQLAKEGYLIKIDSKDGGRGAWHIYKITDDIYQSILLLETSKKLTWNPQETYKELYSQLTIEPTRIPSSVSSDLNIPKTNYCEEPTTPDKQELPLEWKEIDYSCLSPIGFRECHIKQIFESGKAPLEMVQESIYELEHDLKLGNHGMRSPLLVLLKQLRSKGEPYTAVNPGYLSDEIRYEQKRFEELKRRQAAVTQLKEGQQELLKHDANVQEEKEFQAWKSTKTEAELKSLAGKFNLALPSGLAMIKAAFRYERQTIRAQVEQSLSQNINPPTD